MTLARWLIFIVLLAMVSQDSHWSTLRLPAAQSPQLKLQYQYHLARFKPDTHLPKYASMAIQTQQLYWLQLCAQLDHPECLYSAARMIDSREEKHKWLLQAAELGHGPSQYQLAVAPQSTDGFKWLERAAQQGYPPAVVARFEYASQLDNVDETRHWQAKAAHYQWDIAIEHVQGLLIQQGSDVAKSFLSSLPFPEVSNLESLLQWYESTPQVAFLGESDQCTMRIQMVAESIAGTKTMRSHYQRLLNDSRLAELSICLSQPKILSAELLSCTNNPVERMQCNLAPLIELAQHRPFSHAIVIGQQGKANVHNGLMYLDLQDDYDVLVHELAHFAGFVDEYKLTPELAALHCKDNGAANLFFAASKPLWQQTQWRNYRPDIDDAIGLARTCDGTQLQAFKPVSRLTFMEYHELSDIPDIYLEIWSDQLKQPEQLTPIYVNFAQYFDQLARSESANYWWNRYERFRTSGLSMQTSMAE